MESNLKQEAMKRVGEVEHHECYYDTDRNKPLPGAASKCATHATIIAAKDGEIGALTAEVTHLAEKLAERDAVAGSVVERQKALNEAWHICVAQADKARSSSGAARAMACADAIQRLAAAPQPVDAAQALPDLASPKGA